MRPIIILFVFAVSVFTAAAQEKVFVAKEGAIHGYDPVAYFTESKPVKGSDNLVYQWKDASWHFSSQQNLELFKANPEKYAPQYGGYCAYGTSNGYKAPTEPEAWTIVNGKLYLNYNLDVKKEWSAEQTERIKKADEHWVTLESKKE